MCVILCNHDDHNVVTTSLETLQQLLMDIIEPLKTHLTCPNGIENSIDNIAETDEHPQSQSISARGHLQSESEMDSVEFHDASDELLESDNDVPKFRFLSSSVSDAKDLESEDVILSRRDSDTTAFDDNVIGK